jgi:hypothetical protein
VSWWYSQRIFKARRLEEVYLDVSVRMNSLTFSMGGA